MLMLPIALLRLFFGVVQFPATSISLIRFLLLSSHVSIILCILSAAGLFIGLVGGNYEMKQDQLLVNESSVLRIIVGTIAPMQIPPWLSLTACAGKFDDALLPRYSKLQRVSWRSHE